MKKMDSLKDNGLISHSTQLREAAYLGAEIDALIYGTPYKAYDTSLPDNAVLYPDCHMMPDIEPYKFNDCASSSSSNVSSLDDLGSELELSLINDLFQHSDKKKSFLKFTTKMNYASMSTGQKAALQQIIVELNLLNQRDGHSFLLHIPLYEMVFKKCYNLNAMASKTMQLHSTYKQKLKRFIEMQSELSHLKVECKNLQKLLKQSQDQISNFDSERKGYALQIKQLDDLISAHNIVLRKIPKCDVKSELGMTKQSTFEVASESNYEGSTKMLHQNATRHIKSEKLTSKPELLLPNEMRSQEFDVAMETDTADWCTSNDSNFTTKNAQTSSSMRSNSRSRSDTSCSSIDTQSKPSVVINETEVSEEKQTNSTAQSTETSDSSSDDDFEEVDENNVTQTACETSNPPLPSMFDISFDQEDEGNTTQTENSNSSQETSTKMKQGTNLLEKLRNRWRSDSNMLIDNSAPICESAKNVSVTTCVPAKNATNFESSSLGNKSVPVMNSDSNLKSTSVPAKNTKNFESTTISDKSVPVLKNDSIPTNSTTNCESSSTISNKSTPVSKSDSNVKSTPVSASCTTNFESLNSLTIINKSMPVMNNDSNFKSTPVSATSSSNFENSSIRNKSVPVMKSDSNIKNTSLSANSTTNFESSSLGKKSMPVMNSPSISESSTVSNRSMPVFENDRSISTARSDSSVKNTSVPAKNSSNFDNSSICNGSMPVFESDRSISTVKSHSILESTTVPAKNSSISEISTVINGNMPVFESDQHDLFSKNNSTVKNTTVPVKSSLNIESLPITNGNTPAHECDEIISAAKNDTTNVKITDSIPVLTKITRSKVHIENDKNSSIIVQNNIQPNKETFKITRQTRKSMHLENNHVNGSEAVDKNNLISVKNTQESVRITRQTRSTTSQLENNPCENAKNKSRIKNISFVKSTTDSIKTTRQTRSIAHLENSSVNGGMPCENAKNLAALSNNNSGVKSTPVFENVTSKNSTVENTPAESVKTTRIRTRSITNHLENTSIDKSTPVCENVISKNSTFENTPAELVKTTRIRTRSITNHLENSSMNGSIPSCENVLITEFGSDQQNNSASIKTTRQTRSTPNVENTPTSDSASVPSDFSVQSNSSNPVSGKDARINTRCTSNVKNTSNNVTVHENEDFENDAIAQSNNSNSVSGKDTRINMKCASNVKNTSSDDTVHKNEDFENDAIAQSNNSNSVSGKDTRINMKCASNVKNTSSDDTVHEIENFVNDAIAQSHNYNSVSRKETIINMKCASNGKNTSSNDTVHESEDVKNDEIVQPNSSIPVLISRITTNFESTPITSTESVQVCESDVAKNNLLVRNAQQNSSISKTNTCTSIPVISTESIQGCESENTQQLNGPQSVQTTRNTTTNSNELVTLVENNSSFKKEEIIFKAQQPEVPEPKNRITNSLRQKWKAETLKIQAQHFAKNFNSDKVEKQVPIQQTNMQGPARRVIINGKWTYVPRSSSCSSPKMPSLSPTPMAISCNNNNTSISPAMPSLSPPLPVMAPPPKNVMAVSNNLPVYTAVSNPVMTTNRPPIIRHNLPALSPKMIPSSPKLVPLSPSFRLSPALKTAMPRTYSRHVTTVSPTGGNANVVPCENKNANGYNTMNPTVQRPIHHNPMLKSSNNTSTTMTSGHSNTSPFMLNLETLPSPIHHNPMLKSSNNTSTTMNSGHNNTSPILQNSVTLPTSIHHNPMLKSSNNTSTTLKSGHNNTIHKTDMSANFVHSTSPSLQTDQNKSTMSQNINGLLSEKQTRVQQNVKTGQELNPMNAPITNNSMSDQQIGLMGHLSKREQRRMAFKIKKQATKQARMMAEQNGYQVGTQFNQTPQIGASNPQNHHLGPQNPLHGSSNIQIGHQLGTQFNQTPQIGASNPQNHHLGPQNQQHGTSDIQISTSNPQIGTSNPQNHHLGPQNPQIGTPNMTGQQHNKQVSQFGAAPNAQVRTSYNQFGTQNQGNMSLRDPRSLLPVNNSVFDSATSCVEKLRNCNKKKKKNKKNKKQDVSNRASVYQPFLPSDPVMIDPHKVAPEVYQRDMKWLKPQQSTTVQHNNAVKHIVVDGISYEVIASHPVVPNNGMSQQSTNIVSGGTHIVNNEVLTTQVMPNNGLNHNQSTNIVSGGTPIVNNECVATMKQSTPNNTTVGVNHNVSTNVVNGGTPIVNNEVLTTMKQSNNGMSQHSTTIIGGTQVVNNECVATMKQSTPSHATIGVNHIQSTNIVRDTQVVNNEVLASAMKQSNNGMSQQSTNIVRGTPVVNNEILTTMEVSQPTKNTSEQKRHYTNYSDLSLFDDEMNDAPKKARKSNVKRKRAKAVLLLNQQKELQQCNSVVTSTPQFLIPNVPPKIEPNLKSNQNLTMHTQQMTSNSPQIQICQQNLKPVTNQNQQPKVTPKNIKNQSDQNLKLTQLTKQNLTLHTQLQMRTLNQFNLENIFKEMSCPPVITPIISPKRKMVAENGGLNVKRKQQNIGGVIQNQNILLKKQVESVAIINQNVCESSIVPSEIPRNFGHNSPYPVPNSPVLDQIDIPLSSHPEKIISSKEISPDPESLKQITSVSQNQDTFFPDPLTLDSGLQNGPFICQDSPLSPGNNPEFPEHLTTNQNGPSIDQESPLSPGNNNPDCPKFLTNQNDLTISIDQNSPLSPETNNLDQLKPSNEDQINPLFSDPIDPDQDGTEFCDLECPPLSPYLCTGSDGPLSPTLCSDNDYFPKSPSSTSSLMISYDTPIIPLSPVFDSNDD